MDQRDETSYDWFSEVSLPLGLSSPSLLSESPFWNSDFARPRDRAILHLRASRVEPGLELGGRAIPYKAEIAAWRSRGGRAQRDTRILPPRRPMEIDQKALRISAKHSSKRLRLARKTA